MEKSGMEGRYGRGRGLLMTTLFMRAARSTALALVGLAAAGFPCRSLAESGPDEPLLLLVSVSPERPTVDAAFIVSILIDHPVPTETTVVPPPLPTTLALERTRTEPRLIRGTQDRDERWTSTEFTFALRSDEDFILGPFEVSVPGKRAVTSPMTIRVAESVGGSQGTMRSRRLEWRDVPSSLKSGESAEVLLVLTVGPRGEGEAGEEALVAAPLIAAPENALMEALPLKSGDGERGVIGRFKLTALQAPAFFLPPVSLTRGGGTLRALGVSVPVSPGRPQDAADSSALLPPVGAGGSSGDREKKPMKPAFPALPRLPPPLRASASEVYSLAGAAWSIGDHAAALAVLRRAERDSSVGFALAAIRREAESALGIENTPDEPYAPAFLLSVLSGASLLLSLCAFFSARRVTSGRRRGYKVAAVLIVIACFSLARLLLVRMDAAGLLGRGSAAVSPACVVYRIPETDGGISTEFTDGQAVRLHSSAGSWVFAEAADGRSGWVERDRMIRY